MNSALLSKAGALTADEWEQVRVHAYYTDRVKVWAREHYDWSTPGTVRRTVTESNLCTPGSGVSVTVTEGGDGGSHLHLEWERHPSNARGRVAIGFMRLAGRRILRGYTGAVLAKLAAADLLL